MEWYPKPKIEELKKAMEIMDSASNKELPPELSSEVLDLIKNAVLSNGTIGKSEEQLQNLINGLRDEVAIEYNNKMAKRGSEDEIPNIIEITKGELRKLDYKV